MEKEKYKKGPVIKIPTGPNGQIESIFELQRTVSAVLPPDIQINLY